MEAIKGQVSEFTGLLYQNQFMGNGQAGVAGLHVQWVVVADHRVDLEHHARDHHARDHLLRIKHVIHRHAILYPPVLLHAMAFGLEWRQMIRARDVRIKLRRCMAVACTWHASIGNINVVTLSLNSLVTVYVKATVAQAA